MVSKTNCLLPDQGLVFKMYFGGSHNPVYTRLNAWIFQGIIFRYSEIGLDPQVSGEKARQHLKVFWEKMPKCEIKLGVIVSAVLIFC